MAGGHPHRGWPPRVTRQMVARLTRDPASSSCALLFPGPSYLRWAGFPSRCRVWSPIRVLGSVSRASADPRGAWPCVFEPPVGRVGYPCQAMCSDSLRVDAQSTGARQVDAPADCGICSQMSHSLATCTGGRPNRLNGRPNRLNLVLQTPQSMRFRKSNMVNTLTGATSVVPVPEDDARTQMCECLGLSLRATGAPARRCELSERPLYAPWMLVPGHAAAQIRRYCGPVAQTRKSRRPSPPKPGDTSTPFAQTWRCRRPDPELAGTNRGLFPEVGAHIWQIEIFMSFSLTKCLVGSPPVFGVRREGRESPGPGAQFWRLVPGTPLQSPGLGAQGPPISRCGRRTPRPGDANVRNPPRPGNPTGLALAKSGSGRPRATHGAVTDYERRRDESRTAPVPHGPLLPEAYFAQEKAWSRLVTRPMCSIRAVGQEKRAALVRVPERGSPRPRSAQASSSRYSFTGASFAVMSAAAALPAPMARMTVAAPVTMSPPAQMRGSEVWPVFSSASI